MTGVRTPAVILRAGSCSVIAFLCLVVAGCGGGSQRGGLPHATGTRLAQESDLVATRLARGDKCGAARAVSALRADARRIAGSGQVAHTIALGLEQRASALAASITCVPAPPAVQPQPASPSSGGRGQGGDNGNGGDGGGGGGD